jgi:hypothetical protein
MPTLPALASAADMAAYGYDAVSTGVLARASVRVRRFLRQDITAGSSTITVSTPGPWLLPQRPVRAVVSVVDASSAAVDYELRGSMLHPSTCPELPGTVVYQHGFLIAPDELIETVCAVASRISGMPAAVAAGVRTEQAGGEAVTWGAEAFAATAELTAGEKAALRRLFPKLPHTTHLI